MPVRQTLYRISKTRPSAIIIIIIIDRGELKKKNNNKSILRKIINHRKREYNIVSIPRILKSNKSPYTYIFILYA